jgi:hypothetical protein
MRGRAPRILSARHGGKRRDPSAMAALSAESILSQKAARARVHGGCLLSVKGDMQVVGGSVGFDESRHASA